MEMTMVAGMLPMMVLLISTGGAGPVGLPPLSEDAVLMRLAPEKVVFFASNAGAAEAKADGDSAVERLLAEPEVRQFIAEIDRLITRQAAKGAKPGVPSKEQVLLKWLKAVATRPMVIYISDVAVRPDGPPEIRGGAAIELGDQAKQFEKSLLDLIGASGSGVQIEKAEFDGQTVSLIRLPGGPPISVGVHGRYLLVSMGKDEMASMVARAKDGAPPAWLAEIGRRLPVERRASVMYLDIRPVLEQALPMAPPEAAAVIAALGLAQIQSLSYVGGLDRGDVVFRSLVAFDGPPQGLLRLFAQRALTADDLRHIPADATFAGAMRLDVNKAWAEIRQIAATVDPMVEQGFEMIEGQFEQFFDLRLVDDFLRPMGDTWTLFDSPTGGGLGLGVTLVGLPTDAKALTATNKRLVRNLREAIPDDDRAGFRIVETELSGQTLYSIVFGDEVPFRPCWCITDKHLVVGLFPQSIKAFLSGPPQKSLADSAEVAAALRPGVIGTIYLDQRRWAEMLYPMVPMMAQAAANEMKRNTGIEFDAATVPSARAIIPHLGPTVSTVARTENGIEGFSRQRVPMGGFASPTVMAGLLLPAVQSAREAARQAHSMNNMKHILLAMHNYHEAMGAFPAAYSADKEGKPLLSWRVHILPYIEEQERYKQFHLDEPWDSEHNKKLIEKMPTIYRSPNSTAQPGKTNYLTIRGKNTVFSGDKDGRLQDVVDGMSNTVVLIESPDAAAVPWTKPDDFEFDPENPAKGLFGMRPNAVIAGFADGSVRMISDTIGREVLKALFEQNDGTAIDMSDFE